MTNNNHHQHRQHHRNNNNNAQEISFAYTHSTFTLLWDKFNQFLFLYPSSSFMWLHKEFHIDYGCVTHSHAHTHIIQGIIYTACMYAYPMCVVVISVRMSLCRFITTIVDSLFDQHCKCLTRPFSVSLWLNNGPSLAELYGSVCPCSVKTKTKKERTTKVNSCVCVCVHVIEGAGSDWDGKTWFINIQIRQAR